MNTVSENTKWLKNVAEKKGMALFLEPGVSVDAGLYYFLHCSITRVDIIPTTQAIYLSFAFY